MKSFTTFTTFTKYISNLSPFGVAIALVAAFTLLTTMVSLIPAQTTGPTTDQLRPNINATDSRVLVLVNGRYSNAAIDPTTIAITGSPSAGYVIKAIVPATPPPATSIQFKAVKFNAAAGDTSFVVAETGTATIQGVQVYRNGLLLASSDDYSVAVVPGASVTATLVAANAAVAGDIIQVTYWKQVL